MSHAPFAVLRPLLVVAATVVAGACTVNVNTEGATASETLRFELTGAPQVTLDTFDGAIEVHSWDRAEVEVVVEKQAQDDGLLGQIAVERTQTDNVIGVRVTGPQSRPTDGIVIGVSYSPTARLRVALPRTATLTVRSGDGSVSIEDVAGGVDVRTADGSVTLLKSDGPLRVRTDDGSVRLREVKGAVDVETLDGSIGVTGVLTTVRAKTNDGSVRVTAEQGSTLQDDWRIESADGGIEVRLPSEVDAGFDLATRDGRVSVSHPGVRETPQAAQPSDDGDEARDGGEDRDDRRERQRERKGTLGRGGKTLHVRTGDGSIRIES